MRVLALCAIAAGTAFGQTKAPASNCTPPKTSWGDPDLQGVWTSDDSIGVPFERPKRYGNRKLLNDDEYAERAKEMIYLRPAFRRVSSPTRATGPTVMS